MRAAILALAVTWSVTYLAVLLLFVPGRTVPCGELRMVGPDPGRTEAEVAAIYTGCRTRHDTLNPPNLIDATAPWSWLFIWVFGLGLTVAAARIVAGRRGVS